LQAAYDAALRQYHVACSARDTKAKVKAAFPRYRNASGAPPVGYVCRVCNEAGHFVVNCPVVRLAGPQDLYGRNRYRSYARRTAKGKPTVTIDCSRCGEADEPPAVATGSWSINELDAFPMRETCLQQNVLVADLSEALQQRLWLYVARMVMPDNPEVAAALAACVREAPTALRVKELCESIEAFAVLVAFLGTACAQRGRSCSTIADLACGHGLVGILLAYRFPHCEVLCVDLAQRPAFASIVGAFRAEAGKLRGWEAPLQNLSFVEGSFECAAVRARLTADTFCVALHACTEANGAAIEMAAGVGAMWAVMPCCMRTAACFPERCQLVRCPDATRHALLCGALVERHSAELVVSIDRRITNRHVIFCGGIVVDTQRVDELRRLRAAREAAPPRPASGPVARFHIAGKAKTTCYPDWYGRTADESSTHHGDHST
jgi:hypothetical protein